MSWEIESEHLDKAEMEHVTVFVEKSVMTRSGHPQRHLLQIKLNQVDGNGKPVLEINEKGEIVDGDGKHYDHKAKQNEVLAGLTQMHARADLFARKHNVPLYKGPKA